MAEPPELPGDVDAPDLALDEAAGTAATASEPPKVLPVRNDDHRGCTVTELPPVNGELATPHVSPAQSADSRSHMASGPASRDIDVYGALDLGTNNCRLLLATPTRRGFRVIDSFSRIIRLGEGVTQSGALSRIAMDRTIDALRVCAGKIRRHQVSRARLVATEACRVAGNGQYFLDRVKGETGLELEMLSRQEEARLAVAGCSTLIDPDADFVLVFDIGGGSTEVVWLDLTRQRRRGPVPFLTQQEADDAMLAWTSLPVGVVTLAETFGSGDVTPQVFEAMVSHVGSMLSAFEQKHGISARIANRNRHLLGTSGTVTTVAGILLGLPRYDRAKVDGCWVKVKEAQDVTASLLARTHEQRIAEPCVGRERADLVLAGCAILEALLRQWPAEDLRVADRGLREGILATLMSADGVFRTNRRRR